MCSFSKMERGGPYQCLLCPRSFAKYSRLHKHVTFGHHVRRGMAWCGVCNQTFTSLPRLMVHTLYYCKGRPECLRYSWLNLPRSFLLSQRKIVSVTQMRVLFFFSGNSVLAVRPTNQSPVINYIITTHFQFWALSK